MPAKSKPAAAKKHTNPKGRVAFFCYVKPATLKVIKNFRLLHAQSQGHVIDMFAEGWIALPVVPKHGALKRPIA